MRKWVADAPHPPDADLANALEAAAFRPHNFTSKGIVIVNSGVSHMQCQGFTHRSSLQLSSSYTFSPPACPLGAAQWLQALLPPHSWCNPAAFPLRSAHHPPTFSWTCARLVWSIGPPLPALLQPLSSGTCRQQVRL